MGLRFGLWGVGSEVWGLGFAGLLGFGLGSETWFWGLRFGLWGLGFGVRKPYTYKSSR